MTEPSPAHGWPEFVTAIAVVIAAILQKLDSIKVRRRLDHSARIRDTKLGAIHDLVNGNVAEQKRLNMMQARRIADLTKGQPGNDIDVALALESERIFKEHQERVLRVDLALTPKYKTGDTDRIAKSGT